MTAAKQIDCGSAEIFGTWRLVSCEIEFLDSGEREELYGRNPVGRLILGADYTMMALLLHEDAGGTTGKQLMAYSGRFRIEYPRTFVTEVDMAWDKAWLGTHPRYFDLEDDVLDVVTPPQTHPAHAGLMVRSYMRWRRETD